ncbi:unnamed protein product [Amoebophrya sp. A25]|nr:unnamed protein product [Amoebophrya sp. A25]|eukprot:GSA25T00012139001.1
MGKKNKLQKRQLASSNKSAGDGRSAEPQRIEVQKQKKQLVKNGRQDKIVTKGPRLAVEIKVQADAGLPGGERKNKKGNHQIPPLYEAGDLILTVGDGDLSFSVALARRLGAGNFFMQPTLFDTRKDAIRKYPDTLQQNVKQLQSVHKTQPVQFGIDARSLLSSGDSRWSGLFSKVVFNFPHCGAEDRDGNEVIEHEQAKPNQSSKHNDTSHGPTGILAREGSSARVHQDLLVSFLAGAADCLDQSAERSEIHIAVRNDTSFSSNSSKQWRVPSLAKLVLCPATGKPRLKLDRTVPFQKLPGYCHRRTNGLAYEKAKDFNSENIHKDAVVHVFTLKKNPRNSSDKNVEPSS